MEHTEKHAEHTEKHANTQKSTRNTQKSTRTHRKSTRNTQKSTWNTQKSTWNTQKSTWTRKERKTASQAEQQHNVNSTCTSLLMAVKKTKLGLVISVLASAVRMNDALRSIKESSFSCCPSLNEGWRTAKRGSGMWSTPRSDLRNTHGLPLPGPCQAREGGGGGVGGGGGAKAASPMYLSPEYGWGELGVISKLHFEIY